MWLTLYQLAFDFQKEMTRKLPQQDRYFRTVEAILTATAHILTKKGYASLSTNRIAERAGVSIGSLYQYFPNKEAIIKALRENHVNDKKLPNCYYCN